MLAVIPDWAVEQALDVLFYVFQTILSLLDALHTSIPFVGRRGWGGKGAAARSMMIRGSKPAPPTTIGIIFAEPVPQEVSLQGAVNLAVSCAALGLEYVYMYDPSGQLKASEGFLKDRLAAHPRAASQGLAFALARGWPGLAAARARAAPGGGKGAGARGPAAGGAAHGALARWYNWLTWQQARAASAAPSPLSGGSPPPAAPGLSPLAGGSPTAPRRLLLTPPASPSMWRQQQQQQQQQQRLRQLDESDDTGGKQKTDQQQQEQQQTLADEQQQQEQQQQQRLAKREKEGQDDSAPQQDDGDGSAADQSAGGRANANGDQQVEGQQREQQQQQQPEKEDQELEEEQQQQQQQEEQRRQRHKAAARTVTVHLLSAEDAFSPALAAALRPATPAAAAADGKANGNGESGDAAGCVYADLAASAGAALLRAPQLLLVAGPALTLAGYPPFHARSAQIYHLGPARAAGPAAVERALARYAAALQRHGA